MMDVKSYLSRTHYRVVGLLHVVKRYPISNYEGLNGQLSERQSLLVGQRYIAVCRAKKKAIKAVVIGVTAILFVGGIGLGFMISAG